MAGPRELIAYAHEVALELCEGLEQVPSVSGEDLERAVAAAMQHALHRLAQTGVWGRDNQLPSGAFWRTAAHWLERGPLQLQARAKPLGYAGDFDLLNRICEHGVAEEPVARAFDRFFQSQAAPQAVRNRSQLMADQILRRVRSTPTGSIRLVSVGSGPAWELQRALQELKSAECRRLEVLLLDLDPHALDFSQRRLKPWSEEIQLRPQQVNLKRLPRRPRERQLLQDAHMIYCLGFFDYLSHDEASSMLSALWEPLAAGGELWVFQFSEENPSRAYMEWCGNWYLQYRRESHLREIAASIDARRASVRFGSESAGVNLYLHAQKPAGGDDG